MDKEKESDFGKGFVYNFILFANHFGNRTSEKLSHIAFIMNNPDRKDKNLSPNPTPENNYGWNKDMVFWFEKIKPIWGSVENALSHEIELWANGASDHLYELEIPSKMPTEIKGLAKSIQDKALNMGHGFSDKKMWKFEDYTKLWEDTKKLSLLIDKALGVETIKGKWE